MSDKPDHEQEVREARETVRFVMRRKYAPDLKECQELLDRFEAAVRASERAEARQVLEATPSMFALEELSRWPKAAEGHPFVMFIDGKTFAVQPDKVKGIFVALREYVKEIAPSAWKAMQAYYRIDRIEQERDELRAKAHVKACECATDTHFIDKTLMEYVDPRCQRMRSGG